MRKGQKAIESVDNSGLVRPERGTAAVPKCTVREGISPEGNAVPVEGGSDWAEEPEARGGVGSVGGSSSRKRTVVKKVVRVVKKMVKKKVPKRVLKDGGLGNKELEKVEYIENLGEKNASLEPSTDVSDFLDVEKASNTGANAIGIEHSMPNSSVVVEQPKNEGIKSSCNDAIERENSKPSDSILVEEVRNADSRNTINELMEVEKDHKVANGNGKKENKNELQVTANGKPSGVQGKRKVVKKRVIKKVVEAATGNAKTETEKDGVHLDEKNAILVPKLYISESRDVDKSAICSKEMEKAKSNDAVPAEVKNEDSRNNEIESMGIEKLDCAIDSNKEDLEVTLDENLIPGEMLVCKVGSNMLEPPVSGKTEGIEDQLGNEKIVTMSEISDSDKSFLSQGDWSEDQSEKKRDGAASSESMDLHKHQVGVQVGESGSNNGVAEGVKETLEKDSNRLEGEIVWSGEMEAVERKRRRKTEIFLGGLDKDAKEDDIRKVLDEVGEIAEVRLVMNSKTGKNKGFAFVRYTSASDAKKALTKYSTVKICGKECRVTPVEGNDTIFISNINKKWKTEDVTKLLKEAGIERIDKVTVKADPNNIELNRGFSFVEFETYKDAQTAYRKMQNKDVFGRHQQIKVAWAQPLVEPDEEEVLKVKSVYAEYLPSSWDEEEVREYFKRFGEIENVTLSKNLASSRRKDFAFVNYTSRGAALACIEAFSREQIDNDGSKVKVKVSLAKPIAKGKLLKHLSNTTTKEVSLGKRKAVNPIMKRQVPRNKGKPADSSYAGMSVEKKSSVTDELVQLLRQQALSRPVQPGSAVLDHQLSSLGHKRPFPFMVDESLSSDPRGFPRLRPDSSRPIQSPSSRPYGVSMASPSYYRQEGTSYASGSVSRVGNYPSQFQIRSQTFQYGDSAVNRKY